MTVSQNEPCIGFRIAPDGTSATLIIPAALEAGRLAAEAVIQLARQQGIEVDAAVAARIREVVASFQANPGQVEEIVAEAVPPEDGEDGRLEWLEAYAPIVGSVPVSRAEASGRIDYYNCVSYRCVTADTQVAQLHEPTKGKDGHDVLGQALQATPGQKCDIKLDACFDIDDEGRVVSQRDGLLEVSGSEVKVSDVFPIKGSVDFSTGNIDFVGSVTVNDSVCDRFSVRATENIFVRGLIQAATLDCGGNLCCGTGMAGRRRGWVQVAGSAEMVYLNEVNGVIKGDLHAGKELINCWIVVGGDLVCRGAVIGGGVGVCGNVQVGHIGASCGTPTTLMLGLPALKAVRLKNLGKEVAALEARLQECTRMHETLMRVRSRTSRQKQRLDKLSTEMADLQEQLAARRAMAEQIEGSRHGDAEDASGVRLEVQEAIFPRVRLIVEDHEFVFDGVLAGPVTISSCPGRQPSFHHSDGRERPLAEVAEVIGRAA